MAAWRSRGHRALVMITWRRVGGLDVLAPKPGDLKLFSPTVFSQ